MSESQANHLNPQEWTEAPSEFDDAAPDLAAYWESASPETQKREATFGSPPVEFTPLYVTLSDSDIDEKKSSTLLHCRLDKPCLLKSSVKGEGYKMFPVGTIFGIWTKPGMKPLKKLANVKCWMRNGQLIRGEVVYFKEIDRPSPMVLFDVRWPKNATISPLTVREDYRKTSLSAEEKLRRQKKLEKAALAAEEQDDDEFVPF